MGATNILPPYEQPAICQQLEFKTRKEVLDLGKVAIDTIALVEGVVKHLDQVKKEELSPESNTRFIAPFLLRDYEDLHETTKDVKGDLNAYFEQTQTYSKELIQLIETNRANLKTKRLVNHIVDLAHDLIRKSRVHDITFELKQSFRDKSA